MILAVWEKRCLLVGSPLGWALLPRLVFRGSPISPVKSWFSSAHFERVGRSIIITLSRLRQCFRFGAWSFQPSICCGHIARHSWEPWGNVGTNWLISDVACARRWRCWLRGCYGSAFFRSEENTAL